MLTDETYPKIFTWLAIGLLITFLTGYTLSLNEVALAKLLSGGSYIVLVILEVAVAIFLSVRITKMSKMTATICYLLYTFLTGLTFGGIFISFKLSSIIAIFLASAVVFGLAALIGYTTKKDMSKFGSFLIIALLGIIIMSIINIFLKINGIQFIISIIGVVIFIGYTMYDINRIKQLDFYNEESGAIYGAFQLYLDFINIFIELLNLFGDTKD